MSRRRVAAIAAFCIALVPSAAASPTPNLSKLVGQSIMTGFAGTQPSPSLLRRIRAGQVGGVILFGANIQSDAAARTLIATLQHAAAAGGNPKLLIATDQEGGDVRRFADGPPANSEAATTSVAQARSAGAATGVFLRREGVNVDLTPVLDSPASAGNFLGTRAYGGDPSRNGRFGTAFIRALQTKHVAATAKHFPGLGNAYANTDTNHVWITVPKAALDARLAPFAAAVRAGVDLVMVSNAGYRAYDASGLPAVLSHPIVTGLLRHELGFRGVVISDSMSAPGPSSHADAPVKAVAAGTDVLLYTSEADSATAYDELLAGARSGRVPLAVLRAADARILALKRQL